MLDWILSLISVSIFVLYHVFLGIRIRFRPLSTVIGLNHLTRQAWVERIMQRNQGQDGILAVQSLRNNIMAASLLASTAILLASTLAGFAASTDKWIGLDNIVFRWSAGDSPLHGLSDGKPPALDPLDAQMLAIKFLTLILTFLTSFFCYTQAIRLFNHVSVLINLPLDKFASIESKHSSPAGGGPPQRYMNYVTRRLEQASNFYTIGTRFYYLAMIFLLWLFGPVFMLLACCGFVIVFFFLDRASLEDRSISYFDAPEGSPTPIPPSP